MTDGGVEIFFPKRWRWPAVGVLISGIALLTAGYVTLEGRVSAAERAVIELASAVGANYDFQVYQRERVWTRVNQLEQAIQQQRELTAGITARLDAIDNNVTRILNILESRRTP